MYKEGQTTKWINQDARRKANKRARGKANAAKWNRGITIFSFGVLAIILVIGLNSISNWITAYAAILGLATIWLIGWIRARHLYPGFLAEELAQCPDDWKDYYQILRVSPNADFNTITEAYHSLYHTLNVTLSDYTQETPFYSELLTDVNEAHKVLSDSTIRIGYDRVFWLRYNGTSVYIEEPAKHELVDIAQSITARLSESLSGINWKMIPLLNKITRPVVLGVSGAVVAVLLGGTSFAFANPEHPMAVPFKGMAITLTQATAGSVSLIASVRKTIATVELHTVSTSLQSMRMENNLKENPAIIVSTNDMAYFPSQEYPLFPDYLDRRFSQFKYTVNSKGIISVDTSWAITDDLLDRIVQTLERLEKNNQ